jgi:bifunctional non-homologous end joining protein LigD
VRVKQFVLDGEAVILGLDGTSDFNALHSRKHDEEVQFCAFDILGEGGDDLRKLPLHGIAPAKAALRGCDGE